MILLQCEWVLIRVLSGAVYSVHQYLYMLWVHVRVYAMAQVSYPPGPAKVLSHLLYQTLQLLGGGVQSTGVKVPLKGDL